MSYPTCALSNSHCKPLQVVKKLTHSCDCRERTKKKSQKSVPPREVCSCSGAFHSVAVWQPGADAGKEGQSRSIGKKNRQKKKQEHRQEEKKRTRVPRGTKQEHRQPGADARKAGQSRSSRSLYSVSRSLYSVSRSLYARKAGPSRSPGTTQNKSAALSRVPLERSNVYVVKCM